MERAPDRALEGAGECVDERMTERVAGHTADRAPGRARILVAAVYHSHLPYFWQVTRGLAQAGWPALFLAFTPREQDWLDRQQAPCWPLRVHHLSAPSEAVFSDAQVRDILSFSIAKAPQPVREADWVARLQAIGAQMEAALLAHQPEAVLIWNGSEFIGKALAVLARRHGVRTVFLENGYFPATLQIDTEGVNSSSSLTRRPFEALRAELARVSMAEGLPAGIGPAAALAEPQTLSPTEELGRAYDLRRFLSRHLDAGYFRKFPELQGSTALSARRLRKRRAAIPVDTAPLPARFVFLPFQVHDDTQILENSPHFRSMEAFFEHCHAAIRRCFGPDMGIVVKEHPEDLFRHGYEDLRQRYPDVLWLTKFDVDRLIRECELVMVVNSSVGLQAIAAGKPVVTFGESFYARPEICFPVVDLVQTDALLALTAQGLSAGMHADAELFIAYLRQVFFVDGSWSRVELNGVRRSVARVLELLAPRAPDRLEADPASRAAPLRAA